MESLRDIFNKIEIEISWAEHTQPRPTPAEWETIESLNHGPIFDANIGSLIPAPPVGGIEILSAPQTFLNNRTNKEAYIIRGPKDVLQIIEATEEDEQAPDFAAEVNPGRP